MSFENSIVSANQCLEQTKKALIKKVNDQILNQAKEGQFCVELYIQNIIEFEVIENLRKNGFMVILLSDIEKSKYYKISWESSF